MIDINRDGQILTSLKIKKSDFFQFCKLNNVKTGLEMDTEFITRDLLVCFMAEPITRKETVTLMAMKTWISWATQEKLL